jgi:hypothetical protein
MGCDPFTIGIIVPIHLTNDSNFEGSLEFGGSGTIGFCGDEFGIGVSPLVSELNWPGKETVRITA